MSRVDGLYYHVKLVLLLTCNRHWRHWSATLTQAQLLQRAVLQVFLAHLWPKFLEKQVSTVLDLQALERSFVRLVLFLSSLDHSKKLFWRFKSAGWSSLIAFLLVKLGAVGNVVVGLGTIVDYLILSCLLTTGDYIIQLSI